MNLFSTRFSCSLCTTFNYILLFVFAFLLTACGSGGGSDSNTSAPNKKPIVVAPDGTPEEVKPSPGVKPIPEEIKPVTTKAYIEWFAPDTKIDGTLLEDNDIIGYEIRYQTSKNGISRSFFIGYEEYSVVLDSVNLKDSQNYEIAAITKDLLYSEFVKITPNYRFL